MLCNIMTSRNANNALSKFEYYLKVKRNNYCLFASYDEYIQYFKSNSWGSMAAQTGGMP